MPPLERGSARVLNLREATLLRRVILPGAMPAICTGATLALVFSLVMLAAAELIGAILDVAGDGRNRRIPDRGCRMAGRRCRRTCGCRPALLSRESGERPRPRRAAQTGRTAVAR